jgi:CRP-like cAMP-binding protein
VLDHRLTDASPAVIRRIIDGAALFRDMAESVRASCASAATARRYRNGEYLWRAGESGDSLQVVGGGLVHIGVASPDGEQILLHVVARGECIGEPSIYAPEGDRQTDARAVGETTVVFIPGRTVRPVLEANPAAMRVFVRRVSEMCRAHARRVAASAFHDARGRLARVLLDFASSHGSATPRGHRIELRLSQRTLAGLVSARRESVNRIIRELESAGALHFEEGIITIREPQVLRASLGADGLIP